ncbi:MAG: nuclear transport factor 2 family protein [Pseudomonadota bacterium]|nr:MAG: nuclear transport factor 2 family protein [Pseudomonadota bacterium]
MGIVQTFESFAADFEVTVQDDNWSRLEKYLAEDATYENVGGPDPKCNGRTAVVAYWKNDVANNDRRFDTRTLVALTSPTITENRLSRRWRCTYTLAGTPDLVVEGEARYLFDGDLIKAIEEEVTPASLQNYSEWMQQHGDKLYS